MRLSFGRKLTLAFAAAVAILLATAVVSYRNTRELLRTTDAVSQSQSVLAAIDAISASLGEAETLPIEVGVARAERDDPLDSLERKVRAGEARLLQLVSSGSAPGIDRSADVASLRAQIEARLVALQARRRGDGARERESLTSTLLRTRQTRNRDVRCRRNSRGYGATSGQSCANARRQQGGAPIGPNASCS